MAISQISLPPPPPRRISTLSPRTSQSISTHKPSSSITSTASNTSTTTTSTSTSLWGRVKSGGKTAWDKTYKISDAVGIWGNKQSAKIGVEAFYPTSLDLETSKAARILRTFSRLEGVISDEEISSTFDDRKKKQKVIKKIPPGAIRNAKGLAIFTVMRTGLVWSGAGGSGVVVAKLPDGTWSPPSGILLHTIGFGFLVGIDVYDVVLVLRTESALRSFLHPRVTLGGEVSVAAGPVGNGAMLEAGVERSPVWSYVKSKGFYAGVQLDGNIVIERTDENARAYHTPDIKAQQILQAKVAIPGWCEGLFQTIAAAGGETGPTDQIPLSPSPADSMPSPSSPRRLPIEEEDSGDERDRKEMEERMKDFGIEQPLELKGVNINQMRQNLDDQMIKEEGMTSPVSPLTLTLSSSEEKERQRKEMEKENDLLPPTPTTANATATGFNFSGPPSAGGRRLFLNNDESFRSSISNFSNFNLPNSSSTPPQTPKRATINQSFASDSDSDSDQIEIVNNNKKDRPRSMDSTSGGSSSWAFKGEDDTSSGLSGGEMWGVQKALAAADANGHNKEGSNEEKEKAEKPTDMTEGSEKDMSDARSDDGLDADNESMATAAEEEDEEDGLADGEHVKVTQMGSPDPVSNPDQDKLTATATTTPTATPASLASAPADDEKSAQPSPALTSTPGAKPPPPPRRRPVPPPPPGGLAAARKSMDLSVSGSPERAATPTALEEKAE